MIYLYAALFVIFGTVVCYAGIKFTAALLRLIRGRKSSRQ